MADQRLSDLRARQYVLDTCRTIGHAWFETDHPTKRTSGVAGWYLVLQCERCDCRRVDSINLRGDLGQRNYYYPEDYDRGEKLTRADYRVRLHKNKIKRGAKRG